MRAARSSSVHEPASSGVLAGGDDDDVSSVSSFGAASPSASSSSFFFKQQHRHASATPASVLGLCVSGFCISMPAVQPTCTHIEKHTHTYTHTHRESTRVTEKKIHSLSLNIILSRRTAPPTLHPHNHPPPQETTPNQTQSQLYHTFISPSTSALTLKSRRIPATTPTISLSLFLPSSCEASPSTRSKSSKRRMSYSKSSNRETASKIH